MAYGKSVKKNFYSQGSGEIAMPPEGEMPPVLADSPELFSQPVQQVHPSVRNNNVEEYEDAPAELQDSHADDNDEPETDQEEQEASQAPQQKQSSKSSNENLRILRESRERAEWERDTIKAQMLEMQRSMQMGNSAPVQKQQPEPEVDDFNFDIADDALIEGKDAKRLVQELQKVKKQLRQFGSQSQETAIEAKIRASYPDFGDVVSPANVARLNQEYPEIAQTLRDNPDLWSKASAAYSIMKQFGIYKDTSYRDSFTEDKMKAIKNSQKPKPLASVSPQQGDSPLSKANAFANGLSKDLQKQLLEEMNAARRNV